MKSRMNPVTTAQLYIEKYFPTCEAAILAGSAAVGKVSDQSDLDIIVFDRKIDNAYRESLVENDWPIELFVYNLDSYKAYFLSDCERGRPTLPHMVIEGIVLKDSGKIDEIKKEAQELLHKGPAEWTKEQIDFKRYFITDALNDLIGSSIRAEEIFIMNTIVELISEFILRTNRKWIGHSKWQIRLLQKHDKVLADKLIEAADAFYINKQKQPLITFVNEILQPFGGTLFAGYSIGKN